MSYYTTVVTVNSLGQPVKAEVKCGGVDRGYTDKRNGELTFELGSNDRYDVSARRYGTTTMSSVKGGESIVLRLA